jgi:hypothetical protein
MAAQPNTIVQLNDYCVVEFFTEEIVMSSNPLFHKLYNIETGVHQIYNPNAYDGVTLNTQDYSVVSISPGQYVYMDQEVAVPYWDRYPEKFYKSTPGNYDTFNKVRFHFTSGFDFAGLPGLILGIKNKMNNGTYAMFAQLLVTAELYEFMVKFNTSPIYLADAIFDRYVEVFVPAISAINTDYYALPPESRGGEFGALITYSGTNYSGFVQNAPIVVSIEEVSRFDTLTAGNDMYQLYISDNHYESVVIMNSLYQKLGVFIGESDEFDAIEFYATMLDDSGNTAFVEALINEISTNAHDKWVIAHQLVIHEWIGGVKTLSGRYMVLQETEFDGPMYYRPILRNSNSSIAFEVEYTCRLYNKRNGDQIIRLGSYISYNTRKYGRSLETIPLDAEPSSHIIYNKIVRSALEATELFVEQNYININPQQTLSLMGDSNTQQQTVMSLIPMFFNVNSISVSMKDALIENENVGDTLVYKQGDLMFVLTPFDNMFKFKVHTLNNAGDLVPMDLSGFGNFNIVFMDNGKKVKFGYLTSTGTSNPSIGELMFKVPQSDAEILINSDTREWYITLVAADNTETALYSGFWRDPTEKADVDANIERVRQAQSELLSGNVVSYFSTQTGVLNVPAVASAAEQSAAETPAVDTQVHIPGYVPAGNSGGDVSIIQKVSPSLLQSQGDAKQSKADSALGKALGNQARKIIPKRG